MAPSSPRLAARLSELSHAQLLEIAVAGCEASLEVASRAEAFLTTHKLSHPHHVSWSTWFSHSLDLSLQPELVEGVLLSSDLAPYVLAHLQLEDGAAAAVCSLWAEGWKATSEGRRRLTRVNFDFPGDLLTDFDDLGVILREDQDRDQEQLVVSSGHTVSILDRSMNIVDRFLCEDRLGCITADTQSIYGTNSFDSIIRLTHDGAVDSTYEDPDGSPRYMYCPVLAPGGLLFCVSYNYEQNDCELDEIVALDAHSLEPRYLFGKSLLNDARGLALVGEELFVCDMKNDRLQVFSLTGEHRRSITGEWKRPSSLCVMKDRLYLVEHYESEADGPYKDSQARARRIFVLSLQGDTLQVYPLPIREGSRFSGSLVCFDGKLLVPYIDSSRARFEIVALLGA